MRLAKSAMRFGQWYVITSSSNRIRNFVTPIRHPWRTCTGNLMEKCEILKVWDFLYKQERHHRGMFKWYLNERFQKASWIRDLPNHGFPLCKCFIVYKCSLDMPKAVNYLWKYVFKFWCFNQIFEGVAISSGFIKNVFLSRIFVTQSITKCPRRQQYCIFLMFNRRSVDSKRFWFHSLALELRFFVLRSWRHKVEWDCDVFADTDNDCGECIVPIGSKSYAWNVRFIIQVLVCHIFLIILNSMLLKRLRKVLHW